MKRIGLWPSNCLPVCVLCLAVAGCGKTGDDNGGEGAAAGEAGGTAGFSVEDIEGKIGDYMPTLEGGTLKIAAPREWEWERPRGGDSDYLVGFHKKGSLLNNLPRILVTVEDSPFASVSDVNEDNVDQLVALVSQTVDASKLKEAVQPVILGRMACARYVGMAKKRNALVAKQTLITVVGGRAYTIRLEAYDREFTKYRDMGYAVAASMKFSAPGTPGARPEEDGDDATAEPADTSPTPEPIEKPAPVNTDSES
ncbi:MAG: hypothetical protein H8E44_10935 [Planctomycetes bacterium]|nr:hypothetical protein [Planctomycetota bacterium]MBL7042500.1 hypothetical protein [Pirellulaceae bacterium]